MENTTYESCFICRENYNENNTNTTLTNCNHKYHCSCLLHWLSIGKKCPYCDEPLVHSNIQATNMEDLKRQILETERIRLQTLRRLRREQLNAELKPNLRLEGKYLYWDNFKEYCEYYDKSTEDVRYYVKHDMVMSCEIIEDGNILKIRGVLSHIYLHQLFKKKFGIK